METLIQMTMGFISGVIVTILFKLLLQPLKKCECEDGDSLFANKGKWKAVYECVGCHHVLTHFEKMHSSGVCPYCGHNADSTVCKTVTKSVEEVE